MIIDIEEILKKFNVCPNSGFGKTIINWNNGTITNIEKIESIKIIKTIKIEEAKNARD